MEREISNTAIGDIAYWELTHAQAAHHHWRVADHHARRARRFADVAIRKARKAEIACWVAGALIALSLLLRLVSAAMP